MIVLIDDLRSFKEEYAIADHVVIRTAREAEEWLSTLTSSDTIDQLWLDHDLGEVDGVATDIMNFVNTLEQRIILNDNPPYVKEVIIHTSNASGRSRIANALSGRVGRVLIVDAGSYLHY